MFNYRRQNQFWKQNGKSFIFKITLNYSKRVSSYGNGTTYALSVTPKHYLNM